MDIMQTSPDPSPDKGALEADLKNYEDALQGAPHDPEIWKSKAETLQALGRTQDAATAWLITAKKYAGKNQPQETITAAEICRTIGPTSLEILTELGQLYLRLRQFPKARDIFQTVLQQDENSLPAMQGLNHYHSAIAEYWRRKSSAVQYSEGFIKPKQSPSGKTSSSGKAVDENSIPTPYSENPIEKLDAKKLRPLMHALWGQFGASTTRYFQTQNPDKVDTSYLESGVYFGPLDPAIHDLLNPCFDDAFLLTDPQDILTAGGADGAALYKPTGTTLAKLQEGLDLLSPDIERLTQSYFKIESVICRSINVFNQDTAFKWHKDGYPNTVRRILIWMDSPDVVGGTEIIDWNGKTQVVTGDGPTWVMFDNGPLIHTGHYKSNQNRKTIDITLSPAFKTDTTPRIHGPAFMHQKPPLESENGLSIMEEHALRLTNEAMQEIIKT